MSDKTMPKFTENQILAKIRENDFCGYYRASTDDISDETVLEWLTEYDEDILQDKKADFIIFKTDELRQEAIAELTGEWEEKHRPLPYLQRKLASRQQDMFRLQSDLEKATADVATLAEEVKRGVAKQARREEKAAKEASRKQAEEWYGKPDDPKRAKAKA